MSGLKKKAKEEIAAKLRHELWEIQHERYRNKREIIILSEKQRVLKKKAVEIRHLIRELGCPVQEPN